MSYQEVKYFPKVEPFHQGFTIAYHSKVRGCQPVTFMQSEMHKDSKESAVRQLADLLNENFRIVFVENWKIRDWDTTYTPMFPTRKEARKALRFIEAWHLAWRMENFE